jgi:hypothetical protein
MLAGTQLAAQQQPVIPRHHDVEHDQVHLIGFEKGPHLTTIRDHGGAQAILDQVIADQLPDFPIIIHDQYVIDMFHALLSEMRASIAQCDDAGLPVGYAPCVQLIQPKISKKQWRLYRSVSQFTSDTYASNHGVFSTQPRYVTGL